MGPQSSKLFLRIFLLFGCMAAPSFGQTGPGGGPPPFDPAQAQQFMAMMQQRILDGVKEALGSDDKELRILQPRLEKVLKLRFELAAGGMAMMARAPGGAPGFFNLGQPPSNLQRARDALGDALDNKHSTPEQIKARMTALRDALAAARAEFARAQDDLRDLLTARQEAILVTMGLLD